MNTLRRFWEDYFAGPWRWRNPMDREVFYLVHYYGVDARCPCPRHRRERGE